MRSHPLPEARTYADLMLTELRKVIPSFLKRVDLDRPRRRLAAPTSPRPAAPMEDIADQLFPARPDARDGPIVDLVDYDPDAEVKLVTAMLYPYIDLPESQIEAEVRAHDRPTSAWRSCGPTSATAATVATSRDGRSSGRATASTCWPTTAPSATSSVTAC